MLPMEAREIQRALDDLPASALPLLHIGSSTLEYRTNDQPYVGALFRALEEQGAVVHADLKNQPGVDVVADFSTEDGRHALRAINTRSVLCSNILEHLDMDPWTALDSLLSLVAPGGYAIITGPTVFGLHPDPIDNGFRPTALEVARHVPSPFEVVSHSQVKDQRLAFYYADSGRNWWALGKSLAVPRDLPVWSSRVTTLTRRAEAFLVIARRPSEPTSS